MELRVAPLPASPVPHALLDDAETLTGAFVELARRFPDHEALIFLDRTRREQRVSIGHLWARARDIQNALTSTGVAPGGVVLLALPTGLELTAAYFGVILAGGVPAIVATPFHRFADRHVYVRHVGPILQLAQADAIYCTADVAEILRASPALSIDPASILTPAAVGAGTGRPSFARPGPDDLATIQYTSGSTGVPKGVLLSHRSILNNMRATRAGLQQTPRDVSVNWAPLYHDMGLIDTYLRPLFGGSHTILIPTSEFLREPTLWLWAIHHYRATISWAPNFAYTLCASRVPDADIAGLDLSSWRVAVNASEPCLVHSIDGFAQRYARFNYDPAAHSPAWGVAEAVCIATAGPVGEKPRVETIDRRALATDGVATACGGDGIPSVSIGTCLPGCQVEIRDAEGRVLPDRSVGAMWLKTRSLFSGYQRNPELTAQVFVDGWFNTGDRGYLADGYVYFVSRQKDLIVIAGEKYAPHDVESAINRVPGVREGCAVAFGVINDKRGTEDVAAVVETRSEGEKELAELREAIRAEVTRTTGLALRYVILVPPGGIEKTTSGKLARTATRQRYLDELDA